MTPDKKYMSQAQGVFEDNDIKFVPPAFMNVNIHNNVASNVSNNRSLDLFSSETGLPELCYYSDEHNDQINSSFNSNIYNDTIPTTFDVLRNLDLDLDESEDLERANSDNDINKIYLRIERRHPGIFATLYSYRIPRPIVRVIIKRIIRLTLSYCNKNSDY